MRNFTFFPFVFLLTFFWSPLHASSEILANLEKSPTSVNSAMMADNMVIGQLYTRANYTTNGRMHDSFAMIFAEGFDNDITPADAPKPMNFDENIARNHGGTLLSIERRDMPVDGEVYQLFSNNYRHTEYTLVMTVKDMEHMVFYLDDAFTGESFMLNTGVHPYNFNVSNTQPESKSSSRFSIRATERAPFILPYTNDFLNEDDFNEALALGFQFESTTYQAEEDFIKITDGSIVSPKIDFSEYDYLYMNFDISTAGIGSGQKLSVSISNNNGLTYQLLEVIDAPSAYTRFDHDIDLSSLNGNSGRIKLEMIDGTGSIHFRDFLLRELTKYIFSNGIWTPTDPSGIATDQDNITVLNGTTDLIANTDVNNLVINPGATLNINNVLNLHGNLSIEGDLVFVSNATGNGELGFVATTSNITGEATVQSFMSDNRSYRMVSSAVSTITSVHDNWQEGASSNVDNPAPGYGTHITGTTQDQTNGFDGTATGASSMYTVNVFNQSFQAVSNTNIDSLHAGKPFLLFVRGDRSIDLTNNTAASETVLRAKGSLHTGTQAQNFYSYNAGDFAMIGNPYQSAVDINSVLANSANVNTNQYYVYDPNLATYGAYVTVDLGINSNTSGSGANQFLQPGQAAQVASTHGADYSLISFNESDKAPGKFTNTSATDNSLSVNDMLIVQLYTTQNYNDGGPTHDSFGIIFGDGLDNAVTPADAIKPMNFYENIARDHNGTYLSLERREMPQPGEVLQLFSDGYTYTAYTLKMSIEGLENTYIYLDDYFTESSTLIESQTAYPFIVDANNDMSIATNRFSLRVEQRLGVDNNGLLSGVRLFPNPLNDHTFYVNAPKLNGETMNVTVNDMLGREVYNAEHTFSDSRVQIHLANDINSGVYMVTLSSKGEVRSLRVIKR